MIQVEATCSRCPGRLRLLVKSAPPDRHHNVLPDTNDLIRQLADYGWTVPGPLCAACQPAPAS